MSFNNVAIYADVATRVRHQLIDALEAANPFYPSLCMEIPSASDKEDYDWLGSMPGMREWLGDRKFNQISSFEFTIKNKTWESSIRLPKEKIDDGNTGYFGQMADALANEASYHPDELLLEVMNNAGAIECFDGQFFFDTDHESDASGTQSNDITASAVAPATPTEAEARAAVQAALLAMLGFKRDNGKPYFRPRVNIIDNLMITCPLAYYPIFDKAFNQVVTEDNGAGVSNYNIVRPQIVPLAEMTGNIFDLYHLGDTMRPFVFQNRQPLIPQTKGEDDREYKDIKVMLDARYNIGVLAWWKAVRTTFT